MPGGPLADGLEWWALGSLTPIAFALGASRLLRHGLIDARRLRRLGMGVTLAAGLVATLALGLRGNWAGLAITAVFGAVLFEGFRLALFCPSCRRLVDSAAWLLRAIHCPACGTLLVEAAGFEAAKAAETPR